MPKQLNLIGQKFGKSLVLEQDIQKSKEKHRSYWICQCDCGNLVSINGSKMKSGHTSSCGCKKYENVEDLTNQIFGYLQVIELDKEQHKDGAVWKCKCLLCNNTELISVKASNLKSGHVKSCGCLAKEYHRIDTIKDMSGLQFGYLQVLKCDEERSHKGKGVYWICKCTKCNSDKLISIHGQSLRNGHTMSCGCINSKGEALILQLLDKMNIEYKRQYSFKDLRGKSLPLLFDFAIFDKDKLIAVIEYQGSIHYTSCDFFDGEDGFQIRQEYDDRKRQYCKKNKIKLIEIPYWDFDKIDEKYLRELIYNE